MRSRARVRPLGRVLRAEGRGQRAEGGGGSRVEGIVTLYPQPSALCPSTLYPQPSALCPSTLYPQPSALCPSTLYPQPSTRSAPLLHHKRRRLAPSAGRHVE